MADQHGCDATCNEKVNGPAYADVQWGGKMPAQTATLCRVHTNELWEQLNPLLQANLAWFRMGPPGSIKAEMEANKSKAEAVTEPKPQS